MKHLLNIWLFLVLMAAALTIFQGIEANKVEERLLDQRIKQGDGYPPVPVRQK
jgi:hypothetical protein